MADELLGGGAPGRVLGQAGRDQVTQRPLQRAQFRLRVQDPVDHDGDGVLAERGRAGRGEDHRDAPGEHVGRGRHLAGAELLGREVGRGPHRHPGRRHPRRVQRPGDAEVDHHRALGAHQHVGGLEVAVQDARAVDRRQRGGRTDGEALQGGAAPGPLPVDQKAQGRSRDVLAHDVRAAAGEVGVQHGRGAEPGHPLRDRHLAQEAGPGLGIAGQPVVQELDGDLLAPGPPPEVDDPLATLAEPSDQLERAQPRWILPGERLCHVFPRNEPRTNPEKMVYVRQNATSVSAGRDLPRRGNPLRWPCRG